MYSTKLTSKNQTTIPEQVRKFLGIKPGEKVEWVIEGDKVILRAKKRYENPLEIIKTLQIDTEKDVKTLGKEAEAEITKEALRWLIDSNVIIPLFKKKDIYNRLAETFFQNLDQQYLVSGICCRS